jgi:hypothetical protein
MMIIIYGYYTGQHVFNVFTLPSSMDQANANASKGMSALQGSPVGRAPRYLEARPAGEQPEEGGGEEEVREIIPRPRRYHKQVMMQ